MNQIKNEAEEILQEGLYQILNKYGTPFITGSYYLDLMTWRDLDIYIDVPNESKFFNLSFDLANYLKPDKMNYRNEINLDRPGKPSGLYLGIYAEIKQENWKIDLWGFKDSQIKKHKEDLYNLKQKVEKEDNKNKILQIKKEFCKHPLYRKKFFSMDIYNSVIENEVTSINKFKNWLKNNKNIKL
ncbi:MAG: hypothetical protein ACOC1O_03145 [bacterium]